MSPTQIVVKVSWPSCVSDFEIFCFLSFPMPSTCMLISLIRLRKMRRFASKARRSCMSVSSSNVFERLRYIEVQPNLVSSGNSAQSGVTIPKNLVLSNLNVKLRDDIQITSAALNTDLNPIPFSPMYSPSFCLFDFVLWLMAHIASTLLFVKPSSLQSIRKLLGL